MKMTKTGNGHTALPWHEVALTDGTIQIRAHNPRSIDPDLVAVLVGGDTVMGTGSRNAALIVRAVNAHEDLVAELERVKYLLAVAADHGTSDENTEAARAGIRAALAKAGGAS